MKCTSTNIFQYGTILHVHVSDGIILHVRLTDVDHGFIIDIVYVSDVRTILVHCK